MQGLSNPDKRQDLLLLTKAVIWLLWPSRGSSEEFDKMNRGQGIITESERIKKLEQRLTESDAERNILRREVEGLKNEVKVL